MMHAKYEKKVMFMFALKMDLTSKQMLMFLKC